MKVMNMPPCGLYAKVGKILPRFFFVFCFFVAKPNNCFAYH